MPWNVLEWCGCSIFTHVVHLIVLLLRECQVKHWQKHKKACQLMAEATEKIQKGLNIDSWAADCWCMCKDWGTCILTFLISSTVTAELEGTKPGFPTSRIVAFRASQTLVYEDTVDSLDHGILVYSLTPPHPHPIYFLRHASVGLYSYLIQSWSNWSPFHYLKKNSISFHFIILFLYSL